MRILQSSMKPKYYIPLLILLLIIVVFIGFFINWYVQQQITTSSGTTQEQTIQPTTSEEQSLCASDWECSAWSECSQSGKQARICTDKNNCGVTANKPTESQSCTPQIIESKPLGPFKIKITGVGDCASKTNQALDLLRNKAKIHYDTIVKYVGIIECTESQSGMYVWENPPRYQVGKATVDAGTIWFAGTITHDACHSKQYHDYLFENPLINVPSGVYTGRSAEAQCLDVQYDALHKIGATQETLDYITNIINSEYWNVDYGDRWW